MATGDTQAGCGNPARDGASNPNGISARRPHINNVGLSGTPGLNPERRVDLDGYEIGVEP